MKIKALRSELLSACQLVSQAVAVRSTKPILSCAKASASDGKLVLSGTDLEIGISYEIAGVLIDEPGDSIFNVAKMVSILRECQDDEVVIDSDESKVIVTTFSSEYEMPSEDVASFPAMPQIGENDDSHEISESVISDLIKYSAFAAAKQDTKYSVSGVLCEFEAGKARMVATDTRAMAVASGSATINDVSIGKAKSCLVPVGALRLVQKVLLGGDGTVKVCLRGNEVLFRTDKATVSTRLLEGRFPPWREIIPKKSAIKIQFNVGSLLSAARQAAIMTDDESKRIVFNYSANQLTITAHGANTGKSKVTLPIEYTGEPLSVNYDAGYVIDTLKVLDAGTTLQLEMVDAARPSVFKYGDNALFLIMPLS